MLTKKDIAIRELCERIDLDTFYNQVLIDNPVLDTLDQNEVNYVEYENELYRTCHVWQGQQDPNGYPYWNAYCKELGVRLNVKAHRLAYAIEYGFDELPKSKKVPNGDYLVLNHLCFNRLCVNPRHLEVITARENLSKEKRKPRNG